MAYYNYKLKVGEEYEENQKDHYLRQMYRMICEIKDMKMELGTAAVRH